MENSLYRAESTQEAAKKDIPGVICPAPLLTFGSLIVGLLLDYFVSLEMLRAHVGRLLRFVVAAILILIGLWLLWVGNAAFRRIGTAVLPWKPSRVLAKTGIYSETRNPIYQGFVVLVLGLAILFRSDWTVLLLVPAVLVLHYGVILREERYLEGKFGDVYRTFTQDVPRYGLPFAASRRAEVAVGLSAAALIAGLIAVVAPREASWTMEPIKIGVRDNYYNWTVPRPALAPLFAVVSDNPQKLASNLRLFEDGRHADQHCDCGCANYARGGAHADSYSPAYAIRGASAEPRGSRRNHPNTRNRKRTSPKEPLACRHLHPDGQRPRGRCARRTPVSM
jgi:protein-S-isoprenylcysteine O-methyltransferase Ste14